MEKRIKIIEPKSSLFDLRIKQIWTYRDLIYTFAKRDIAVVYKQTILGPIWYILQPLLTAAMFSIVFGRIAKISSGGVPHFLFYLAGITCWGYFSECLTSVSETFLANQAIFGKVYFPRIVVPLSLVISKFIKLIIQFALFIAFYFYYLFAGVKLDPGLNLLLLPFIFVIMGGLSLGFGMLFTSLTTKYRDLKFLLVFAVQLWMYATPIIYPVSEISEKYDGNILKLR